MRVHAVLVKVVIASALVLLPASVADELEGNDSPEARDRYEWGFGGFYLNMHFQDATHNLSSIKKGATFKCESIVQPRKVAAREFPRGWVCKAKGINFADLEIHGKRGYRKKTPYEIVLYFENDPVENPLAIVEGIVLFGKRQSAAYHEEVFHLLRGSCGEPDSVERAFDTAFGVSYLTTWDEDSCRAWLIKTPYKHSLIMDFVDLSAGEPTR